LVAYPVVGHGSFDAGGLLIVLIGVLAYLRRRRRSN
jgi:MYXO-CTERM domain-containing protein